MTLQAVILENDEVSLVDDLVTDPVGDREVRVRVSLAGVCGSDLSAVKGTYQIPLPAVLGHEAVGVVTEAGSGSRVPVGARVSLWMAPPCRTCRACLRGDAALCPTGRAYAANGLLAAGGTGATRGGEPINRAYGLGAFATEVVVPENAAIVLPEEIPETVAAFLGCGVATGYGAVANVAGLTPGDTVVVIGAGGVGVSAAMTARALGAGAVIVVDPNESRRDAALGLGATAAVPGGDAKELRQQVRALVPHVDTVIEAVGHPALVESALTLVREGGTVVAVGVQPAGARMSLSGARFALTQQRLLGCFMGAVDPQRDIPIILDLQRNGRISLEAFQTQRVTLSELPDFLRDPSLITGARLLVDVAGR